MPAGGSPSPAQAVVPSAWTTTTRGVRTRPQAAPSAAVAQFGPQAVQQAGLRHANRPAGHAEFGRHVRRASGARVVAITGSAGKTTTKEATAAILAARYPDVYRNEGNLNNHIGLPLSLLDLRRGPEVAVVELGMNHPGEIRRLVEIAEPDVRVWINVGDAHIGHFGSRDRVADAKAEILELAGNVSFSLPH